MNIIWNKEELIKISEFLKRNNLKFSEDNTYDIVIFDKNNDHTIFLPTFLYHCDSLNNLVWYQDKTEIYNVLKKTIPIRYTVKSNKNNPICNGLLTALANINPSDATEVFTILKELLSQYVRVSYSVTERIADKLKDSKLIKEKIEEIQNSPIETKEELYIKNYMSKLLSYTNGIFDSDIFAPLVEECNRNIRTDLIYNMYKKYISYSKLENKIKNASYNNHLDDLFIKLRKSNKIVDKHSRGIRGGNYE